MYLLNLLRLCTYISKNIKLKVGRKYAWGILEKLEKENISLEILFYYHSKNTVAPVIVLNVFESENKKLIHKHKQVIKILDKMIKNNLFI